MNAGASQFCKNDADFVAGEQREHSARAIGAVRCWRHDEHCHHNDCGEERAPHRTLWPMAIPTHGMHAVTAPFFAGDAVPAAAALALHPTALHGGCDNLKPDVVDQLTVTGILMFCASLMPEFRPGPVRLRAAPWRALTRMAWVLGAMALVACATPPPPPVVSEIQLTVVAGPDVNPDARKRASPVLVRIYALKSAAPFEAADFFSLFEKDTATLGAELVQREEFLLRPGEEKALPLKFGPEVKSIGVMVAYRDLERARWRDVHAIAIGKPAELKVRLSGSEIALEHKLLPPPAKK